jgi:hypothetical protein
MAQPVEAMAEDQLGQERADRRSGLERMSANTADQQFMKEVAVGVNELQEHLEDQLRAVGAEGLAAEEPAAVRAVTAKRKAVALATKMATRLRVAARVSLWQTHISA